MHIELVNKHVVLLLIHSSTGNWNAGGNSWVSACSHDVRSVEEVV